MFEKLSTPLQMFVDEVKIWWRYFQLKVNTSSSTKEAFSENINSNKLFNNVVNYLLEWFLVGSPWRIKRLNSTLIKYSIKPESKIMFRITGFAESKPPSSTMFSSKVFLKMKHENVRIINCLIFSWGEKNAWLQLCNRVYEWGEKEDERRFFSLIINQYSLGAWWLQNDSNKIFFLVFRQPKVTR